MSTEPTKPSWLPNPPAGWSQWRIEMDPDYPDEQMAWISSTDETGDWGRITVYLTSLGAADNIALRTLGKGGGSINLRVGADTDPIDVMLRACDLLGGSVRAWRTITVDEARMGIFRAEERARQVVGDILSRIRNEVLLPFCRAHNLTYYPNDCVFALNAGKGKNFKTAEQAKAFDIDAREVFEYLTLSTGNGKAVYQRIGRVWEDDL